LLAPRTSCLNGYPCEVGGDEVCIYASLAALLAADPAWAEVASKCESTKVSGMITSHVMGFP